MSAAEMIPAYADAGLGAFPLHGMDGPRCTCGLPPGKGVGYCESAAKHPLLGLAHRKDDPARRTCRGECGREGHGLYDATTDLGKIAEWLARYPGCNWGVRPPVGAVVLDVDPRNGGDAALAKLENDRGALPPTLAARTGSGGRHIWLSYNGPTRGKLATGIDVKSHTGYLVAPPSLHACGGTYEWIDMRPAAYAPGWVKRILNPPVIRRPGYGGGDVTVLAKFVLDSQEGERNARLYWAACRALEANLDPEPLIAAADSIGYPIHEARATVASATRRGPRTADRKVSP